MSLLAALLACSKLWVSVSFFAILFTQLLRQELCLLRKGVGLLGKNKTRKSVLYKIYPEQRPGAQTLEVTLSPHQC